MKFIDGAPMNIIAFPPSRRFARFYAFLLNLISHFSSAFAPYRHWENELTKARKQNRKPRLRNALFRTFWASCVVDGLLVLIFTLLKSIMPVFLAQLLVQFQQSPKIDNATTVDSYEMTALRTTTVEITRPPSGFNDDDDGSTLGQYMVFIW
jgi:hypothetical protein